MFLKSGLLRSIFLICLLGVMCGRGSANYCSLDRMKKLAMEACEHLFEAYDVRERRSIDHGHMDNNAEYEPTSSFRYVRRSSYPQGGYLKVGIDHYRKLSTLDINPRYKAKKVWQMQHGEKLRFKRNEDSYGSSISYCCFHKCDEDFFC
ncbi:uncharacterized protein LOC101897048 [Musca domestica]|uniref:Uncharacterized protein LOC101897048 n=1 Tax=Musca domestica TaxID=7370 RepID=A0A1I8MWM1_MUSDO|nr:uncharacterized protein LOC101897048 [Musca domestica]